MFLSQVHPLSPSPPPMPTIRLTGTVPSWCTAFYRGSRISPWTLKMVSQTPQGFLDAVLGAGKRVRGSAASAEMA